MIAVEEIADFECAAQANKVAHGVGKTKSDIRGMIGAQAGSGDRYPVT